MRTLEVIARRFLESGNFHRLMRETSTIRAVPVTSVANDFYRMTFVLVRHQADTRVGHNVQAADAFRLSLTILKVANPKKVQSRVKVLVSRISRFQSVRGILNCNRD